MPGSNPFGDPQTAALLGLAQGLLQAGAPSPFPTNFSGALAQGAGGALSGAMNAQKMNQQQALVDLEGQKTALTAEQVKQAKDRQKIAEAIAARFITPQQPGLQPASLNGLSDNAAQSVGAPWAAASGLPQAQSQGAGRQQFPFSLGELAAMHAGAGIDLLPYYKESQPNISNQGGQLIDPRLGIVGAVPQTNQQGYSTITVRDPNAPGGFRVQQVPGGAEAFTNQQLLSHGAQSAFAAPITVPATSPNTPPTLQNPYRLAVSQGAPDVLGPSPGGTPPSGPGGVPAGMSPAAASAQAASAAQQKSVAENYASIYNNLQNASMANPAKIAKVERVGQLLEGFEGGKLSKSAMDFASAANSLNIKLDPKLPAKQAAEALSKEMALDLRSTASGAGMPGAMSDADREYLKSMTPDVGTTAQGRRMIVEAKISLLKRETTVSEMARQYTKKYGGLNEDFFTQLQGWSERNPIFKK